MGECTGCERANGGYGVELGRLRSPLAVRRPRAIEHVNNNATHPNAGSGTAEAGPPRADVDTGSAWPKLAARRVKSSRLVTPL